MARVVRERRQPRNGFPRAALRYEIKDPPRGVITNSRPWNDLDTFGLLVIVFLYYAFVMP